MAVSNKQDLHTVLLKVLFEAETPRASDHDALRRIKDKIFTLPDNVSNLAAMGLVIRACQDELDREPMGGVVLALKEQYESLCRTLFEHALPKAGGGADRPVR